MISLGQDKRFNNLLRPAPKLELESKAAPKKPIAANTALAELKGAGELIPNQGILINAIVPQEANLSSEIENAVPGTTSQGGAKHIFTNRISYENIFENPGFLDTFP